MASHSLDLELAWRRLHWETTMDPFETPDPFTQPSWLRRPEVLAADPGRLLADLEHRLSSGYRPEPFQPIHTSRGPGSRHMACLSLADNLVMLACLARCHVGLAERFAETDRRSDFCFQLTPDPAAASWLRSPFTDLPYEQARQADRHGRRRLLADCQGRWRWWLRADVSSCGYSLDYRRLWLELLATGLPRRDGRHLLRLLAHMSLTRRHGVRSFGCGLCMLTKAYLQPVVAELQRREHCLLYTELDEFHFFAAERASVLEGLEQLRTLLRERGLTLNLAKTRLRDTRRVRPPAPQEPWLERWLPRLIPHLPLLPPLRNYLVRALRSDGYTTRGPAFRDLLRCAPLQEAARLCLADPETRSGDRFQILYWLDCAGVQPQGALADYLRLRSHQAPAFERGLVARLL